MNLIECLQADLIRRFPGLVATIDAPAAGRGSWFLDLHRNDARVVVEWRPDRGFGMSLVTEDDNYGSGPDEVYRDADEAFDRASMFLEAP